MIPIVGSIISIIDKFIPDENKKLEVKTQLEQEITKQMELQADIIKREISQGGLASKWRPYTAITFVAMIVIHYIMYSIVPWVITVFNFNVWIPQDPGYTDGFLELVKFCLGGYIFSRSVEKGITFWRR